MDYSVDPQSRKLSLEIEKLRVETEILKRPWFRQPAYLAPVISIVAVIATGIIAYLNSDYRRQAQLATKEVKMGRATTDRLRGEAVGLREQLKTLNAQNLESERRRDTLAHDIP